MTLREWLLILVLPILMFTAYQFGRASAYQATFDVVVKLERVASAAKEFLGDFDKNAFPKNDGRLRNALRAVEGE